jgi:hypothetical protein
MPFARTSGQCETPVVVAHFEYVADRLQSRRSMF